MPETVRTRTSAGSEDPATSAVVDPPDLRLAGLALTAWLSALTGLYAGFRVTALGALVAGVLALAGAARTVRRRTGRHHWTLIALLLGVVCGAGATAGRLAVRDAEPLAGLSRAGARVTVEMTVRDDPRALDRHTGRPPTFLVRADLSRLHDTTGGDQWVRLSGRVLVLAADRGWAGLLPGQRVRVEGRLDTSRGGDLTAAVLAVRVAPELLGRPSWAQRAAGTLRAGLQRACAPLPDEPGGLLPGLVVGDTSRLEPAVEEDFRTTGMTHLNAVSGSNVAIVIGLVLMAVRWCRAGPGVAAAICGVALLGFVILVRPSPSVVRAAVMGGIGLLALASGRPRAALPALGGAVTVLVVLDPALAADAGFALSVLATGGLLLIAPGWRDRLRARGVPGGLAEALAVPAAAQLACAPVVAGLSGTVSLVAVPANLLVVPAIAPATVLGVATAVVSPVWPAAAGFTAWLGSWPAWWLVTVARYGAALPAGTLPWWDGPVGGLSLGALTVVLLVALRHPAVRRVTAVVVVAVLVGILPVRLLAAGWPPPGWLVVLCAVGQGDTVVLRVGPAEAVVVDAGPEPTAPDRCLRRLGVRTVPVLVVSHFHADHVGGVTGVLRARRVGTVITPDWPEPADGRRAVLLAAAAAGVPVRTVGTGWRYTAGPVELSLLGPPGELSGTRSDPNNNSLVIRARVRGVDVLLPGDAEEEEQRALLDRSPPGLFRAQVLKVAHHGSPYQDEAFLAAVAPAVALVPVGAGNDYGHPSGDLLDQLARRGARVFRTDLRGDLAVSRRSGGGLAVTARGVQGSDRGP